VAGGGVGAALPLLRTGVRVMPKVDVFVRTTTPRDALREGFFQATIARWNLDPDANVHVLADLDYREYRLLGEKMAQSDPFIFDDDDCLPHGKNWIRKGRDILLDNPTYALASTRSLVETEAPFTGVGDIFSVPAVGAPMWVRKGIIGEDLPTYNFVEECIVLFNYMKERGYQSGMMNGIRHMHLGYGFSTDPRWRFGY
jgi:hypothetical protein